jgi:hypothetical protein
MRGTEGSDVRRSLVAAGAASLALGVVLFGLGVFEQAQASAALASCYVNPPMYGYPTACTDAMNALFVWGSVMSLAGVVGVIGFVLLVLGFLLQPEGMRAPYVPHYPPPVYAPSYPPPVYAPPEGPKTPPPGSP